MSKYIYWNNSMVYHGQWLMEICAFNIDQADNLFEKTFGYHPSKNGISCQIIKNWVKV